MAKKCTVCKKSYADDLKECPHCAQAQPETEPDSDFEVTAEDAAEVVADDTEDEVDLSELFDEEASAADSGEKPARRAPETMAVVPTDDDDAIDLGKGKMDPGKDTGLRTKTQLISPEEMDAVAHGKEPEARSVLDSTDGMDLNHPDSVVDLGSSSESESHPTLMDDVTAEQLPVVEQAADEDLPVVEHAAEDDETPAEAAEAEPAMKADKKGGSRMWLGGAVGMVLGSAASVGLIVFNLLPVDSLKDMVGTNTKPAAPAAAPRPTAVAPASAPATAALSPDQYLEYGDFAKALEGLGTQEGGEPAVLVKRGQARWLTYLKEKKQANAPLKKDDEAVVQATKDLTEAKNAEGTLWLGIIEESLGSTEAARKLYQTGAANFKDAADQKLLQSALDRLDSASDAPAAKQQSRVPKPAATALALAVLTIALQDPAAQPKPADPKEGAQPKPADAKEGAAPPKPAEAKEGTAPPEAKPAETKEAAAPEAKPEPKAPPVEEAGAEFWKAARLAKEQKYAEALDALKKARATHDQQRFLRLRKAQNPVTDPTEMIFLRCCDELAAYWQMRQALATNGYLAQGKQTDPVQALAAALTAAKESQGSGKAMAGLAEQLKKDKDVTAADPAVKDVAKAIEVLLAAKHKHEEQLAALEAMLVEAKYAGENQKDHAANVKKLLDDKKTASTALAEAAEALKAGQYVNDTQPSVARGIVKLLEERKTAADNAAQTAKKLDATEGTLKEVTKRLADAKYVNVSDINREALLKGLDNVIADTTAPTVSALADLGKGLGNIGAGSAGWLTRNLDLAEKLVASEASNARYQARLLQVQPPRQMLEIWLPALSQARPGTNNAMLDKARRDAQLVLDDPSSDAAARGLARCVQGLALRGQGKYAEARQALQTAVQNQPRPASGWSELAQQTLQSLTDPRAYYLPAARQARARGQTGRALTLLQEGLGVFGPTTPQGGMLLAERSAVNLALAQAQDKGKLDASNPYTVAASKDAQAAIKAGARAEGSYALGRVQEALGSYAQALQAYEQALTAHPAQDAAGSRFRVALARVLVRLSAGRPQVPEARRTALAPRSGWNPVNALAALLILVQYEEQDAPPAPELDRAVRLADEAIRAGNAEGYLVKALALAARQRWTDAVLEYSYGLEKLSGSADQARILRYLMENHPSLKIPDGQRPPDGQAAERHFDLGLRFYWDRQYAQAEKEFARAIRSYNQDARFLYFLGLAQLGQERRDQAAESFRKAGQLERQGKPQPDLISGALERIQGPQRQTLNQYRP